MISSDGAGSGDFPQASTSDLQEQNPLANETKKTVNPNAGSKEISTEFVSSPSTLSRESSGIVTTFPSASYSSDSEVKLFYSASAVQDESTFEEEMSLVVESEDYPTCCEEYISWGYYCIYATFCSQKSFSEICRSIWHRIKKVTWSEWLIILCITCAIISSVALLNLFSKQCLLKNEVKDILVLHRTKPEEFCTSKACQETSNNIFQTKDFLIYPCDDFYRSNCGRWVGKNAQYSSLGFHSRVEERVVEVQKIIHSLLKRQIKIFPNYNKYSHSEVPSESFIMARDLFKKCLESGNQNSNGVKPLKALVKELLGFDWPILNQNFDVSTVFENDFIRPEIIGNLVKAGFQPFMDISVQIDIRNTSKYIIVFDEMSFDHLAINPERTFHSEDRAEFIRIYENLVFDALEIMNESSSEFVRNASSDVTKLVEFEITLSLRQRIRSEPLDFESAYKRRTVNSLELALGLPRDYLVRVLRIVAPPTISIDEDTQIYSPNLPYLKSLTRIVNIYPRRTLANYLCWIVIREYGEEAIDAFRDRMQIFYKKSKIPSNTSYQNCLFTVMEIYKYALIGPYAKIHFPPEKKNQVEEMVHNIIQALETSILDENKISWLDHHSRGMAVKKLNNMKIFVAYPDWVLKNSEVDKFYAKENFIFKTNNVGSYFYNKHWYNEYMVREEFGLLHKIPNRSMWNNKIRETDEVDTSEAMNKMKKFLSVMDGTFASHGDDALRTWSNINTDSPLDAHVHYNVRRNTIRVMTGLFGGAIYNESRPQAMNYGALGFMIAHEVFHAVDEEGSYFDEVGNLKHWWTTETQRKFHKISLCLESTFNETPDRYARLFLRGDLVNSENMADNAAIRLALEAYRIWNVNDEDQGLKGFEDLGIYHLFFIGFSQSLCDSSFVKLLRMDIETGQVTPSRYKVNYALKYFTEFRNIYSCKKESSEKTCDSRVVKF